MLRFGVQNLEGRAMTYDLRVSIGGVPLEEWRSFSLAPGNSWEAVAPLPRSLTQRIDAVLIRTDRPDEAYRRVTFSPHGDAPEATAEPF
jgi:hypothetical protein